MPSVIPAPRLDQFKRAIRRRLHAHRDPFESDCICDLAPALLQTLSTLERAAHVDRTGQVMDLIQCRCQAITPGSLTQFDDDTLNFIARIIIDLFDRLHRPPSVVEPATASRWFG